MVGNRFAKDGWHDQSPSNAQLPRRPVLVRPRGDSAAPAVNAFEGKKASHATGIRRFCRCIPLISAAFHPHRKLLPIDLGAEIAAKWQLSGRKYGENR